MPSQEELDIKAKEAARRKRSTKPGASSVSADHASRLDQRIEEKINSAGGNTATGTASANIGSSGAHYPTESQGSGFAAAAASKPGAFRASEAPSGKGSVSASANRNLRSLDDAVAAKVRQNTNGARAQPNSFDDAVSAKARQSRPDARAQLSTLEDAITAKVRDGGYNSNGTQSSPVSNTFVGAHAQLNGLEDDVAVKSRRSTGTNRAQAQLSELEDAAVAKTRADAGAVKHGAHAQLQNMQDATSAKARDEALRQKQGTVGATAQLEVLQDAMLTKNANEAGAQSRLFSLEDEVTTKNRNGALAQIDLLEDAAISKAGIDPLDPTSKFDADAKGMGMIGGKKDDLRPEQPEGGLEFGAVSDGLAVAIEVNDEDSVDEYIPSAVEYDPDAKPPIYKNRRFRLYAVLVSIVLIAIGAGTGVGVVMTKDDYNGPTMAPTSIREGLGIRQEVERAVGKEVLENPASPYSKALEWMTFDDPNELEPEAPNFIQRYLLVYLYFATTTDRLWETCNPPKEDEGVLCKFKKLVNIFPEELLFVDSARWLSSAHECNWAGLFCDEEDVLRAMDLSGMMMSGTFPEGVTKIPFLQSIGLGWGTLSGPLPASVVEMQHLINLELHYNEFTGPIPLEWYNSRNLVRINIGDNELTGSLPAEFGGMKDIKGFYLFETMVGGQLPDEMGNLDSMSFVRFPRNAFAGSLPTTMGNMGELTEFWMQRNFLNGPLPTELGELPFIRDMRLQFNSFDGGIPEEFYNATTLAIMDFHTCGLSGTISTKFGQMTDLKSVKIYGNGFSGEIPSELGVPEEISTLMIHRNQLTGEIPGSLCSRRGNTVDSLQILEADCGGDSPNSTEVLCTCCTTCCDSNDLCLPVLV